MCVLYVCVCVLAGVIGVFECVLRVCGNSKQLAVKHRLEFRIDAGMFRFEFG